MATNYTVRKLLGQAWAVMREQPSDDGTPFADSLAVCDRQANAERIAYCLRIVDESEETAHKDRDWEQHASEFIRARLNRQ